MADPTAKEWMRSLLIAGIAFIITLAASAAWGETHHGGGEYTGFGTHLHPEPPAIVTPENGYARSGIGEGTVYSVTFELVDELLGNVIFTNALVSQYGTPDEFHITTDYGVIVVVIDSAPGDEPDTITVTPPAGFYAVQNDLVVQEGETVTIEVREFLLG